MKQNLCSFCGADNLEDNFNCASCGAPLDLELDTDEFGLPVINQKNTFKL